MCHDSGVEPVTYLLWVIEGKHMRRRHFSQRRVKSQSHPGQVDKNTSKCEWETARQDISRVTPAAASDVHELISLQKKKNKTVIFFVKLVTQ